MQYDSLYKFERFLGDRYAASGPPVLTLSPGVVLYIIKDRQKKKRKGRARTTATPILVCGLAGWDAHSARRWVLNVLPYAIVDE